MNSFWDANGTKLLGSFTAGLGAVQTFISLGAFDKLMSETGVGWMNIIVGVLVVMTGGSTIARGFNNSSQAKVAQVIDNALNATPPKQSGFARVTLLAMLTALTVLGLAACKTTPPSVIQIACTPGTTYTVERCVKGIGETYEVYQKRAEEIAVDPGTPVKVKQSAQAAERATTPVIVSMLKSGAFYADVKQKLAAGQTTEEQVAIANANLEAWVKKALPLIDSFGKSLR